MSRYIIKHTESFECRLRKMEYNRAREVQWSGVEIRENLGR